MSTARGLNFAFGRKSEGKRKKTHTNERACARALCAWRAVCAVCVLCDSLSVRPVRPVVCCACASASVRAVCVLCVLCVLCGDSACAVV